MTTTHGNVTDPATGNRARAMRTIDADGTVTVRWFDGPVFRVASPEVAATYVSMADPSSDNSDADTAATPDRATPAQYVAEITYADTATVYTISQHSNGTAAWATLAYVRRTMRDVEGDDTYAALTRMSAQAADSPRYMSVGSVAGLGWGDASATYSVRAL